LTRHFPAPDPRTFRQTMVTTRATFPLRVGVAVIWAATVALAASAPLFALAWCAVL
jgi:hypothetical protein